MKTAIQELIDFLEHQAGVVVSEDYRLALEDVVEWCRKHYLEKEKQLQVDLLEWYDKLSPADKCTVWPPAGSGSGAGLYNMSKEDLIEKFFTQTYKQ